MARLRIGILLIILSWLPVAQVVLSVAHSNGKLTGGHASDVFRLSVWTVQIIIGFVGLWLAGKVAISSAKEEGWRKAPSNMWNLFMHGQ